MTGGPIFLRDLTESLQKEEIANWKRNNKTAIIKAYEAGEDIVIGKTTKPKVF